MTPAAVRADLVSALRDDLLGPDDDAPDAATTATERLPTAPSHWYLTGFLAPTGQPLEDKSDETADEELGAGADAGDEDESEPTPARRPIFPSTIGLSVLVHPEARSLAVRATFGTYAPARRSERPPADSETPPEAASAAEVAPSASSGAIGATQWVRTPHVYTVDVPLNGATPRVDLPLGDSGVVLRAMIRALPASEADLVPRGTRYVTLFLINQRPPVEKPEQDRGFVFQVGFSVECDESFEPRPNLRGADGSDFDENLGDLQYRDAFEYAVGHGISATAEVLGKGENVYCRRVSTTWLPTAKVEKVEPASVPGLDRSMLEMERLGAIADGAALGSAVGALVSEYGAWIARQRQTELRTPKRRDTAGALLDAAELARGRIARGLAVLAENADAMEAFRIANRAMAAAAWQRDGETMRREKRVPTWRPFQLAFLLMNVAAQVDPTYAEREIVDLIFFPTGGGKTEAYLGLAAFALALRRLRHPGLGSMGVAVLMRYTLRLLTLDQLERAATLICALEIERRSNPRLGPKRFSIGLWVGKAATPNRFGSAKDKDDSTARARVLDFARDPKRFPSPVPLDRCPWCSAPFGQDTFRLLPNSDTPTQLRIRCLDAKCAFRPASSSDGLPIVAVDDEIYRELPCFVIATVDKFAALPWVGKTGLLLGRNVTHSNALGFYGFAERPRDAKALDAPLLPPDLIIQDELHLISGPLGTMVGLYETAIDHLTTRMENGRKIRPKIVASTATVRRAQPQIQALFGRNAVEVFPPPGPDRRHSFFAETVPTSRANARLYVGVCAPGRSQKVLLMRAYIALLAAAQRAYEQDPVAADPYMTLAGYFNSLRELGGSRRIVEDEVRARLLRVDLRRRPGEKLNRLASRKIAYECVELTSRESTDRVKVAKARLASEFGSKAKGREPVDVALASNMISVGLDIQRLGLMVVCGQPKTTSEYIQATSRVGRDHKRPGLVVVLLNAHKPRDRSHFEHFAAFHESFYRGVEATSVTPFSSRAVERGLPGVLVALARLGHTGLTAPDGAGRIAAAAPELGFIADVLTARAEGHRRRHPDDAPADELKTTIRQRIEALLDSWQRVAADDKGGGALSYQRFEEGATGERALLHMPLDAELNDSTEHEKRFVANRSMRDVEETADVYVTTLQASANALLEGT